MKARHHCVFARQPGQHQRVVRRREDRSGEVLEVVEVFVAARRPLVDLQVGEAHDGHRDAIKLFFHSIGVAALKIDPGKGRGQLYSDRRDAHPDDRVLP
jgi:hypothetical protein